MSHFHHEQSSRRHFLATSALSLGGIALDWMLARDAANAAPEKPPLEPLTFDTKPKVPPQPAQAKAMISIWMQGGPSHHDMFDPKPEMVKQHGKKYTGKIKYDSPEQANGEIFASPWKFKKHGECGMELSELIPHMGEIADKITLIRSMHTGVNNHAQSIRALTSGRITENRPALGSWLTYGLGCETENLPAYLALIDPGQLPVIGVENWTNGWLPSVYQGTVIRPTEPRIPNLDPPPQLAGTPQRKSLDFLKALNEKHKANRQGNNDLDARIASYELAARMQTSAREALDISQETKSVHQMYGLDDGATKEFGTRCLIARRLIERGVRFVQVFTANQLWDNHTRIMTSLPAACKKIDKPSSALVKDLEMRGLLDSTVVHWGGEMGRLPVVQNPGSKAKMGRDHNTYGFSMWLAGGGFKRGHVHGATDDFGHYAAVDVVNHFDYQATLFHQFGLNHESLTFKRNNREQTITDGQPAKVIEGLLA